MSLLWEMVRVARRAPKLLGDSLPLVRACVLAQQNPDGGVKDRSGRSDLYYTVFGLEAAAALWDGPTPSGAAGNETAKLWEGANRYVRAWGSGEGLDFVHLCCLARAWSLLAFPATEARAGELMRRIQEYRSKDGGYNGGRKDALAGTAYGAFLALGAYEDLGLTMPSPEGVLTSLTRLQTEVGGFANEVSDAEARALPEHAQALATAAALAVRRRLLSTADARAAQWLLNCAHPLGGFRATLQAPLPDLLSTATVLHALAGGGLELAPLHEPCLDFIDSLWTNEGAFYGHWGDSHLDCEYTFYGLLALGHLA